MIFFLWNVVSFDVTGPKTLVQPSSRQYAEYFTKYLGEHHNGSFVKWVLFGQHWFSPSTRMHFLPSLFLIVKSWTLILTKTSEALVFFQCYSGSFCDLLDESLICSWSNFSSLGTFGKVHYCSKFPPLCLMARVP